MTISVPTMAYTPATRRRRQPDLPINSKSKQIVTTSCSRSRRADLRCLSPGAHSLRWRSHVVWIASVRGITCDVTLPSTSVEPKLPRAVGPLSSAVIDALRGRPALHDRPIDVPLYEADPYGLDLQLALYICYELHFRGFDGVNPRWEWNPSLLRARGRLEDVVLIADRQDVGDIADGETAADAMDALSVEPVDGAGPSYYLRDAGTWQQMREYFVHRSLYHLKEADPHAFAIPRLIGQAKA